VAERKGWPSAPVGGAWIIRPAFETESKGVPLSRIADVHAMERQGAYCNRRDLALGANCQVEA